MHGSDVGLALSVFLASGVEMVEALTIVVAVGVTRGWRAALGGAAAAVVVLAALVAVFGPALTRVPLDALRVVIGGLLLVLGAQWFRKAVLRAAGLKAKHDEDAIFEARAAELSGRRDLAGTTVAFKGVLVEGLEVVVIVLTLGAASHRVGLAAAAAGVALLIVGAIGAATARQLAGVPENAMKFVVAVMLLSFGTFWIGEGAGLHWPGSDAWLLVFAAIYAGIGWVLVTALRRRNAAHHGDTSALGADDNRSPT
jgi:uncharacterized membrane protein